MKVIMDKQTYNLLMITYETTLTHLKSSIRDTTLTFDSSNNSPNMSKLDNFIKEAIDVENKIAFLKKHIDYLIDNKHGSKETRDLARKTCSENNTCTDRRPCNEKNNIIRSCNEIRKVKQEVMEVNKNDFVKENIRVEIVNELREKCIDIFNNVVKK
tara:strand:+ start:9999 stop:10469 length:471 start_codon:yes stop_codon:yes gene_type:complete